MSETSAVDGRRVHTSRKEHANKKKCFFAKEEKKREGGGSQVYRLFLASKLYFGISAVGDV